MLVLNRNINEEIKIGDEITVKILNVQGGQVRVGIDAPRHVPVHREEIYELIRLERNQRSKYRDDENCERAAEARNAGKLR